MVNSFFNNHTREIMTRVNDLITRYPDLAEVRSSIENAYKALEFCFENDGKVLVAGNGGSASDSEHLVGELMKSFIKKRPLSQDFREKLRTIDDHRGTMLGNNIQGALPCISLTAHTALITAIGNDIGNKLEYAQQVYGYGCERDVFIAISTSGNAENLINAAIVAKAKDMKVILLSGNDGGKLNKYADISVIVNDNETYRIQERHLAIYHSLCLEIEDHFF